MKIMTETRKMTPTRPGPVDHKNQLQLWVDSVITPRNLSLDPAIDGSRWFEKGHPEDQGPKWAAGPR